MRRLFRPEPRSLFTGAEIRQMEGLGFNMSPLCRACGRPIRIMIRRGTDYCSQACEKAPF